MKVHLLLIGLLGALLAALVTLSPQTRAAPEEGPHAIVPLLEPHGESLCASGCALSRHPTPELTREHFEKLVGDYAGQPMSEESPALEELLFYGPQTVAYLQGLPSESLDPARLSFLQTELRHQKAVVEFRIIDETNTVRVSLPPAEVGLDRRYVFEPLHTVDFQPPEASGTIKRVGLHHVWQRI